MNTLLLIQIINHGCVPARKGLEVLLPPRVRKATGIEDKTTAVTALILWQSAVVGKTEHSNVKCFRLARQALQFFRSQHASERLALDVGAKGNSAL